MQSTDSLTLLSPFLLVFLFSLATSPTAPTPPLLRSLLATTGETHTHTVSALAVPALVSAEEEAVKMGTVIGIDLGTTYSCVGVFKNGRVEIIANDQGNRITPSYVAFMENGERLVGDAAKNQATINPERTVFDVKRLIGRKYSDKSVQSDKALVPYEIVSEKDKPVIQVDGQNYAPEEVSAMILQKMKATAEVFLGKEINNAVVTVPAYL
jgi:heat shock protein 5